MAGAIGPSNITLSLSPRVEDPAYRPMSFDQVYAAYAEQVAALADGRANLLLVETIFDTLNAKAAIAAARDVAAQLPLWISVTIVDRTGARCPDRRLRPSGARSSTPTRYWSA